MTQTEALKLSLAEFENQKAGLEEVGVTDHSLDELITAIKEALAQQNPQGVSNEQLEPVAWRYKPARENNPRWEYTTEHPLDMGDGYLRPSLVEYCKCIEPLYAKEKPKLMLEKFREMKDLLNDTHPPVPTAQPDCTRSHPHEEMSKECELRTEIARLTNQQAHRSQAQLQLKITALEKAWFHGYENDIESAMRDLRMEIISPALEQPEQVTTLDDLEQEIYENTRQFVSRDVMEWMLKRYYTTPYVATPRPQRKPLDMTEIVRLTYDIDEDKPATMAELFAFARAIEAAHGIKEKNT